jgi:hypothetical protein
MDPGRKRKAILIDQEISQSGDGENAGKKKSIIEILKMINPGLKRVESKDEQVPVAHRDTGLISQVTKEESKTDLKILNERKGDNIILMNYEKKILYFTNVFIKKFYRILPIFGPCKIWNFQKNSLSN